MYMILLSVFYYYIKATQSNKYGYGLFKGHKTIFDIQMFLKIQPSKIHYCTENAQSSAKK